MGCTTSKEKPCRHCKRSPSPVARSYSMHVHHPPQRKGDSYHVVALTSSTIDSLKLQIDGIGDLHECEAPSKELGIIEAKSWSTMIDQKIPKVMPRTPVRTPPGEPETINTWELMEGLEDTAPVSPFHYRSFSFNLPRPPLDDPPKSRFQQPATAKPLWLQMANDDDGKTNSTSAVLEFDPEMTRKGEKVVLYFTSLRGVRKTYEDCCHVKMILKGMGVKVDERDVSMHSGFKEELRQLKGEGQGFSLPAVFIGTTCIGGAEEIRRLHEDGQLHSLMDPCSKVDQDGGCVCEGCGDVRFVPCETCSGSCKIYYDDIDQDYEQEQEQEMEGEEAEEYGFQRCPDCNENGLIRCPLCCY